MKYFETRFLEEAEKFIAKLDQKTISKISIPLTLQSKPTTQNYSKNYSKIFGSLEQDLADFKLDCWHFGTKQMIKIR